MTDNALHVPTAPVTGPAEPVPATGPAQPAQAAAAALGVSRLDDAALRAWLLALPGVDEVGADAQAARLSSRPLDPTARARALDLAISMVDLTTLEGADSPGAVRALAAKALHPDAADPLCPRPAAVCVYNDLVGTARTALGESGVKIAAVATAFPSGRASLRVKLADTEDAVLAGADEIDMVIDRGAFLSGRFRQVFDEIAAVRAVCRAASGGRGPAKLKVILETGELGRYDNVRRAAHLAMLAGADTVKTSTGKISPAATPTTTMILLQAVRDWHRTTGRVVGVKPAGGIRTAADALRFLVLVQETAGPAWLTPDRFRFGASALLNDLVLQRRAVLGAGRGGPVPGARRVSLPL